MIAQALIQISEGQVTFDPAKLVGPVLLAALGAAMAASVLYIIYRGILFVIYMIKGTESTEAEWHENNSLREQNQSMNSKGF